MEETIKQEAILIENTMSYLVLGTTSKKRAGQLIRKYEIEEGMAKDDPTLFHDEENLEQVKIEKSQDSNGGDYFYWGKERNCETCHRRFNKDIDGFVYYL